MLLTLSSYSKNVLTSIMIVFPLALGVNSLISPFIVGLSSLTTAMIFVLIISPIMNILMPIVKKLLEKLSSNKQFTDTAKIHQVIEKQRGNVS